MNNIKPKTIYQINEFANMCGYFFNVNFIYPEKSNINNGYNCNHKDCGDIVDGIGLCNTSTCPLGFEADKEDFENPKIYKNGYDEYEENEFLILNY